MRPVLLVRGLGTGELPPLEESRDASSAPSLRGLGGGEVAPPEDGRDLVPSRARRDPLSLPVAADEEPLE